MSERIFPHTMHPLNDLRRGHMARYFLARGYVRPFDRVIDAACGTGYGSNILAGVEHAHVTGFDYSEDAIKLAGKTYTNPNIEFIFQNLDDWNPSPELCEVAVSFESIEHLVGNPKIFADKLKTAASRTIIVSAPIVPTVGVNHYHKHDFTDERMVALFQDDEWKLYEKFRQRVYGIYIFVRAVMADKVV